MYDLRLIRTTSNYRYSVIILPKTEITGRFFSRALRHSVIMTKFFVFDPYSQILFLRIFTASNILVQVLYPDVSCNQIYRYMYIMLMLVMIMNNWKNAVGQFLVCSHVTINLN